MHVALAVYEIDPRLKIISLLCLKFA